MSIHDAMRDACDAVGITPPRKTDTGRWIKTPVKGKAASNQSGRVMLFDDGRGGICWNWATGQQQTFSASGLGEKIEAPKRDPERDRQQEAERREIIATCQRIVCACEAGPHPYLVRKGFPDERGLVVDDPRPLMPRGELGQRLARALPEGDGPLLVIPGRVGKALTTVQFITPEGAKKNILGGQMGGAAHRIATGAETWVAEGIATALSVRAALRLLGRSATVLSAFSASNVAKVAEGISGAILAADHDKPVEQFSGLGTGEYYARRSGRAWTMPPAMGDFNDMHQADGLRAVALHLREVRG